MRSFEMLKGDVDAVIDSYFRQCSLLVTCRDLATMAATLANRGTNPITGNRALGGPAQGVKARQPGGVCCRGDDRLGAEHVGHPGAQRVGAGRVPADLRHRVPARLVHADHGRAEPLAVQ